MSQAKFNYFGMGSGRCTIAYVLDDNRESKEREVKFGISYCSPRDQFLKNDLYRNILSPIVRKDPNDPKSMPLNLNDRTVTRTLVHKGGKTLALEDLENNPKVMKITIPEDENPVLFIIDQLQNYAFDHGPGWKNKTLVRKLKNGGHELVRDGFSLLFADPNHEDIAVLRDLDFRSEEMYL